MSFVLEYRRLFTVSVREESGPIPVAGLSFAPAPRTRALLANHQLTFRPGAAGFEVFYRLNPLAPAPLLGRIDHRVRFTFLVFLADPGFFERYEPDLTAATGPQLYLDNLTAAGAIQPAATTTLAAGSVVQAADGVKFYPPTFTTVVGLSGGAPSTITVRDRFAPATVALQVPILAAAGATQAAARIDLSGRPAGPYTLQTDAPGASPLTIYVEDELAAIAPLGVIDVHWQTAQDAAPAGGVPYVVTFRKR